MVTGNGGLNTNSNKAADKNLVSETLNALANKLYYTGYNNAAIKDNLKGTVEIAEGLTASSASVAIVSGNMSFQDVTGRGEYKFTPAEDDPHGQTTSDFGTPITGEADKDQEYVKANVLKDDVYTFTNAVNTVTVDDGDTTTEDLGYHKAVAAVVGINKDITIHAADKSLKLNAENKTERNSAVGMYTKKRLTLWQKIFPSIPNLLWVMYTVYISMKAERQTLPAMCLSWPNRAETVLRMESNCITAVPR